VIVSGFLLFVSGLFLPAICYLQFGIPCISGAVVHDVSVTFGGLLRLLF